MIHSYTSKAQPLPSFFIISSALAIVSACWIAITANYYGGDLDTYSMLSSYLGVLHSGVYSASRFTGYPVAEIGLGFLAWLGGAGLSNLVTFLLYVGSVLLFPFCLSEKPDFIRYLAYAALALTSPVLVFDNIQSMDYSWGLFFWVLASFVVKKFGSREMFIVFMALAIGSRPSFALFAPVSIYGQRFFGGGLSIQKKLFDWRLSLLFSSLFAGSLFYLPNWFIHKFSVSWITAASSDFMGLHGIIARIVYKGILSIGFLQAIILLVSLGLTIFVSHASPRSLRSSQSSQRFWLDNRFLAGVMLINVVIFIRIPHEVSYLQPFLLAFFWLLSLAYSQTRLSLLILLVLINLTNWFVQPEVLSIRYKDSSLCGAKQAVSATPSLAWKPGRLYQFEVSERQKVPCYLSGFNALGGPSFAKAVATGRPIRGAVF